MEFDWSVFFNSFFPMLYKVLMIRFSSGFMVEFFNSITWDFLFYMLFFFYSSTFDLAFKFDPKRSVSNCCFWIDL